MNLIIPFTTVYAGRRLESMNDILSISYFGAIDEEWIYYSNYSYGGFLYKVRKDGLGTTRLNSEWSKDIVLQGDWILYRNAKEGNLYKIRKDGSERQLVN